ncbi:MAG: histidinol-phosphatase [Clostridiales bacterium]|nr:histidinol-phosphatase [Clostridiales bacterium]
MKKVNYHTHTCLCQHADGTEMDYVNAALTNHLDVLGFSDHGPFPDDRFGGRMLYSQLDTHLACVRELKDTYQDKLTILAGVEIEFCKDSLAYYQNLLEVRGLDYLLLGQHFFPSLHETISVYDMPSSQLMLDYAYSIKEALETGLFSILAHPDVPFICDIGWDSYTEEACDMIVTAAKDSGTVLELNANGLRRGFGEYKEGERFPYPFKEFWQRAARARLPVVIGSDCHNPRSLWDDAIKTTHSLAQDWGLLLTDTIPLKS